MDREECWNCHEGAIPNDGAVNRSQKEAAEQAGMSERQRITAVRVANVPEDAFELAVESEHPPTVTALAEQGKGPRRVFSGRSHRCITDDMSPTFCTRSRTKTGDQADPWKHQTV